MLLLSFTLSAAIAVTATASVGDITLYPPCLPGTPVCYVEPNFAANCSAIGGTAVDVDGLTNCALPVGTLFVQCGGTSCYTTGDANFTAGCRALGGFISGRAQSIPFCLAPTYVEQFTACPPAAGICYTALSESNFASACTTQLGGFVDAYLGPVYGTISECVAHATLVGACGSPLTGCTPATTFNASCVSAGGFLTATSANGIPICALPGSWTSWQPSGSVDQPSFAAACEAQGGFVSAPSVCLLPCTGNACAGASLASASSAATPTSSVAPSASKPVSTTPLPSRSGAASAASPTVVAFVAVALAAVTAATLRL